MNCSESVCEKENICSLVRNLKNVSIGSIVAETIDVVNFSANTRKRTQIEAHFQHNKPANRKIKTHRETFMWGLALHIFGITLV